MSVTPKLTISRIKFDHRLIDVRLRSDNTLTGTIDGNLGDIKLLLSLRERILGCNNLRLRHADIVLRGLDGRKLGIGT